MLKYIAQLTLHFNTYGSTPLHYQSRYLRKTEFLIHIKFRPMPKPQACLPMCSCCICKVIDSQVTSFDRQNINLSEYSFFLCLALMCCHLYAHFQDLINIPRIVRSYYYYCYYCLKHVNCRPAHVHSRHEPVTYCRPEPLCVCLFFHTGFFIINYGSKICILIGLSDFRDFGLKGLRTIGPSD